MYRALYVRSSVNTIHTTQTPVAYETIARDRFLSGSEPSCFAPSEYTTPCPLIDWTLVTTCLKGTVQLECTVWRPSQLHSPRHLRDFWTGDGGSGHPVLRYIPCRGDNKAREVPALREYSFCREPAELLFLVCQRGLNQTVQYYTFECNQSLHVHCQIVSVDRERDVVGP